MATPHTAEDFLRVHDSAIMTWLDGLHINYDYKTGSGTHVTNRNAPVLKVMASPDRAFAEVGQMLMRNPGFLPAGTDTAQWDEAKWFAGVPQPFVPVSRPTRPSRDAELLGAGGEMVREVDPVTGETVIMSAPKHFFMEYSLNFWCHKRYSEAYITEWIESQFGKRGAGNNERYIPVKHVEPFGTINQALRLTGTSDLSDLEGDDQRYIRFEYTVQLRAWMFLGSAEGGTEEEFANGTADSVRRLQVEAAHATLNVKGRDRKYAPPVLETPDLPPANSTMAVESLNLFPKVDSMSRDRIVAALTSPGLTVESTADDVIAADVAAGGGTMLVFDRPATPKADWGLAAQASVLSVSFDYESSLELRLNVEQTDGTWASGVTTALDMPLPAGRKRFHQFALTTGARTRVRIIAPAEGAFRFKRLNIRHVYAPSTTWPERDSLTTHAETGLAQGIYLALARGSGNFAVSSGPHSVTRYAAHTDTGAVLIVSPHEGALTMEADTATADVSLTAFAGGYSGHSAGGI